MSRAAGSKQYWSDEVTSVVIMKFDKSYLFASRRVDEWK